MVKTKMNVMSSRAFEVAILAGATIPDGTIVQGEVKLGRYPDKDGVVSWRSDWGPAIDNVKLPRDLTICGSLQLTNLSLECGDGLTVHGLITLRDVHCVRYPQNAIAYQTHVYNLTGTWYLTQFGNSVEAQDCDDVREPEDGCFTSSIQLMRSRFTPNKQDWLPQVVGAIVLNDVEFAHPTRITGVADRLGTLTLTRTRNMYAINMDCDVYQIRLDGCAGLDSVTGEWKADNWWIGNLPDLQRLEANLPSGSMSGNGGQIIGCPRLKYINDQMCVPIIRDCIVLEVLPQATIDRIQSGKLSWDFSGNTSLKEIPSAQYATLNLRGCPSLATLPANMTVHRLDLDRRIPRNGAKIEVLMWRGVQVPIKAVYSDKWLTSYRILCEGNAEVRRSMMELFGYDRMMRECQGELLDEYTDDAYAMFITEHGFEPIGMKGAKLWKLDIQSKIAESVHAGFNRWNREEPLVMVELMNSTPEPEGYHKTYFLRVPPTMTDVREAVAWTFGKEPDTYFPTIES
jgi:hypothetical protein